MSDHDRGAYTPQSEDPLVFDARRKRDPQQKSGSGVLVFSGLILAVLLIAFAVFAFNRLSGGPSPEAPETYEAIKTEPGVEDAAAPDVADVAEEQGMTIETVEAVPPEETLSDEPIEVGVAEAPAPTPAAPAPAAPRAAPAPKAEPAAPARSSAMVQIGAFTSRAIAESEWDSLALNIPAQMAGKGRVIESVQTDAGTRYRALISGFSSRAEADRFCEQLMARGQNCFARN